MGTNANLVDVTNAAGATIHVGGSDLAFGGELANHGTIIVAAGEGASALTITKGTNTGDVTVTSGTLDVTLDRNDGPISIASGVTGSVTILAGTVTELSGDGAASVTLTVGGPPAPTESCDDLHARYRSSDCHKCGAGDHAVSDVCSAIKREYKSRCACPAPAV